MTRKAFLAGNWKMFKTNQECQNFFNSFKIGKFTDREVALAIPFTSICAASALAAERGVILAGQNVHWEKEGAYTGEISASMLKNAGAGMVIIGHSERRQIFHESDEWINKKIKAAMGAGLGVILCVGESLEDRENNQTFKFLAQQLSQSLAGFKEQDLENFLIAYEPIWAIGTGKTATPDMAQEVHSFIREWLVKNIGANFAAKTRILYGGSVKPDNVKALMAMADIDGALVGGASLEPESFTKIVNYDK